MGIQDIPGFRIIRLVFWIPGTGFWILCQWNLESGLQLLVGSRFLDPYSRFQSPGFWTPQETFPTFWISKKNFFRILNPDSKGPQ